MFSKLDNATNTLMCFSIHYPMLTISFTTYPTYYLRIIYHNPNTLSKSSNCRSSILICHQNALCQLSCQVQNQCVPVPLPLTHSLFCLPSSHYQWILLEFSQFSFEFFVQYLRDFNEVPLQISFLTFCQYLPQSSLWNSARALQLMRWRGQRRVREWGRGTATR